MTDLVVVHPGAAHGIYGELGDELTAIEPPAWSRIIAAYARDRGFSVRIVDAEASRLGPEEVAEIVTLEHPLLCVLAVYGHQPSASTQQMHAARAIALAIRNRARVMMVGGHVAALPARTMAEEQIEFACSGEGPETIVEVMRGVKPYAGIPGLVWREPRSLDIVVNKPGPLLDINELSGDAWDLLPMDKYRAHNWQCFGDMGKRRPYASIYTTLGCPYACSFCCINAPFNDGGAEPNRYRMRNPRAVVSEIVALYNNYGITTFKIVDEMFVLNERHYMDICQRLAGEFDISGTNPLNIWAYARVDTVKPHTLALLRRAGIRWLALGIESASAYVLDGADKRLKPRDIAEVVHAIQAAGINVIGNFIFGLPDDGALSMDDTLRLAQSLRLDFANFYSAMAYPGSPLYREAVAKGWALPANWRGYSQHNDECRPLDTEHVAAKIVLAMRDKAFDIYYRDPEYLARIAQKFGRETEAHVRKMTEYKLDRKLLRSEAA